MGLNDSGQLGRSKAEGVSSISSGSLDVVSPLSGIRAEAACLGHNHTLVIEKAPGRLFGFGEDGRGQVSGRARYGGAGNGDSCDHAPRTPAGLVGESFVDVAAGLTTIGGGPRSPSPSPSIRARPPLPLLLPTTSPKLAVTRLEDL